MAKLFRFLQRQQPLVVYFFAVPHLCLNIMGFWPEDDRPTLGARCRALVHFIVLTIGVLTELHAGYAYLEKREIVLALETFCPGSTSAVTLLKMITMWYYRHDLALMLNRVKQMLYADHPSMDSECAIEKKAIIQAHSMMSSRINFWTLSMAFFTCTVYDLKPVILVFVLYMQKRFDEIVWSTPFNMTMPECLLQAPWFPLTYIFTAYTGYVTIFMFGGSDGFYFEFCSHISSLFKALQAEIRSIFRPYNDRICLNQMESLELGNHLKLIISKHNAIIELTKFFRKRYAIITLAHFVSAGLVIAFSIFNLLIMSSNGLDAILYVAYTMAALSQLLVYCYGGTLVAESSTQLATVISLSSWQLCKPRHRQYILMIILRSQRTVSMAVPFFSPSLPTFASILQTSGSFIALAKSFQ
ncbi:odorant receptor 10a [Drosophila tropicalis]|uniref:odorant receptor 10a n=1 Tax=Drosophila tropicalis TaxID=46794 RepID=UPI0035ABB34C